MDQITVRALVRAPLQTVWERWTGEEHIPHWAFAANTWEAPWAKQDLRVGGTFTTRMQAKDGSVGFDLTGAYTEVVPPHTLAYTMEDGRRVLVRFVQTDEGVEVAETFDPETENPAEMQRAGWQAILDHFKSYAETSS